MLLVGGVKANVIAGQHAIQAQKNCGSEIRLPDGICNDAGVAAVRRTNTLEPVAIVGLVGGLVGIGFGMHFKSAATKSNVPKKGHLEQPFQIGFLSVDSVGAVGGVRGSW